MEDKIAQLMSITNLDFEVAKQYLNVCNNDVNNATVMYFNDPTMFSSNSQSQNQTQPAVEPVRAAIPQHFATLAGPTNYNYPHQQTNEPFRDYSKEWNKGQGQRNNDDKRGLADLFAPPEYCFKGDLAQACNKAMEENKWVMVNIQSTEIFGCHVLNRDCWSSQNRRRPNQINELPEIIKQHFIFIQRDRDSRFGQNFFQLYEQIFDFPFVCILDPITRSYLKKIPLSDLPEPQQIMTAVLEFMDTNQKPNEILGGGPTQPETMDTVNTIDDEDWDMEADATGFDQDEMAAAVAMSLEDDDNVAKPVAEEIEEPVVEEPSSFPDPKEEPAKGTDGVTRIRIKVHGGPTITRRFLTSDTVTEIYSVLQSQAVDVKNMVLKTNVQPRQTFGEDTYQQTLEELGIKNTVLLCEPKD